ncbi:MAG: mannan-binding lectin [Trichodesmium sp. St7_bin2_1]|nr:mannan-binding lectin [Trichodesmium sp. St7_bin2_1]
MIRNHIKNTSTSVTSSILALLLIVSVVFGLADNAFALDVKAGPIWNNDDAKVKCPIATQVYNAEWDGNWVTIIPGEMSVCKTNLSYIPPMSGNVFAGPIWSNKDAEKKCPVAAYAAEKSWNGHWATTIDGEMSVCSLS